MSTIKSSAENLTLNADGANNDVIIQSNGSTKVTVDGQNSRVGIGTASPASPLHIKLPNSSTAPIVTFDRNDGAVRGEIKYDDTAAVRGFEIGTTTSHDVSLKTAGNKRLEISYTGAVTMPSQPCVSARAIYTNIPINTLTLITLDTERFDIGSNLASSTFTAPITGKYLYTYTLYYSDVDSAATALGVQVVTSNKTYEHWITPDHIANSDFNYTMTSSQVADMDANDTLQFKAYCGGGAAQTDVHADSHISIALIA
mgnify:CR=1 FL=1